MALITPADFRVETHQIIWNDNADTYWVNIGFFDSDEQAEFLTQALEDGCETFTQFDEIIYHWIYAYEGETIEDYYAKNDSADFVVVPRELQEV